MTQRWRKVWKSGEGMGQTVNSKHILFQILPKSGGWVFFTPPLPPCPLVPLALWPHFSSFTTSCTYFCYFRPVIQQDRRTFWKSEGGGELKYGGPNLPPPPVGIALANLPKSTHGMVLERWNPIKSLFTIWQCFSCLLDEEIAKIF